MAENILVGTTVRIKVSSPLTAFNGTIVNPDKWTVMVRTPAAEVSTYEWTAATPGTDIVVPSTGYAYIDIATTDSGVWKVIFKAEPTAANVDTTNTAAVKDFVFHVSPLPFEPIE